MEGYGYFIKIHRVRSGFINQKRFADKTGISRATVSRIEKEIQRPTPETLRIFAEHLYTTSYFELLTICGYWSEKIDLTDPQLIKGYEFEIDGQKLTDEELVMVISLIKTIREHGLLK